MIAPKESLCQYCVGELLYAAFNPLKTVARDLVLVPNVWTWYKDYIVAGATRRTERSAWSTELNHC